MYFAVVELIKKINDPVAYCFDVIAYSKFTYCLNFDYLLINENWYKQTLKKPYNIFLLVFINKIFVLQGRHGELPRIRDDNPDHVDQVLVYYFHRIFHILQNQILRYFRFLILREYLNLRFNCLASSYENIKSQKPIL